MEPRSRDFYTVHAHDAQHQPLPVAQRVTQEDAYAFASAIIDRGATYVQVCIHQRGQRIALTDWGRNLHGETWMVGQPIPNAPASLVARTRRALDAELGIANETR